MKYEVTFTRYHTYTVEAEDDDQAEKLAYKEFESDMRRPIADTYYDDVEIEEIEVNEDVE